MSKPIPRKATFIGDSAVGKTRLILCIHYGVFNDPFIAPNYQARIYNVNIDGNDMAIATWDTASQTDYDQLRPLSYSNTDVLVMCFTVDKPNSLKNLRDKWLSEALYFCDIRDVSFVVVGCRADLRDNQETMDKLRQAGSQFVTYEEGERLARDIGAYKYLECSSRDGRGVEDVTHEVARASMLVEQRTKRKECIVL